MSERDSRGGGAKGDIEAAKAVAAPTDKSKPADKAKQAAPHSCLLSFCRIVNVAAGAAALLCLVAHLMALSISGADSVAGARGMGGHTVIQVLRLYGAATACLCLIIEFEMEWVASWVRAAENWLGRGLLQGFLGVLTLELARSAGTSDFDRSLNIYRQVAGFAVIGTALVYFSGGMMCLNLLKKAQHRKAMERLRMERDIEILDRQREDLRVMLASYVKD